MANSKCFIFSADNTWEDACEKVQNGEITRIDFKGVPFDKVKHGLWKRKPITEYSTVKCSNCGHVFMENGGKWNYCPHCGAKMDEVKT